MAPVVAKEQPLIVIVGPTASGKSNLAIEVAKQVNGEILCADSRTVYKGMDIGTAKPSLEEQAGIPHWGIDLVEPSARFTVVQFQHYANKKIKDIRARNKIPIMVGGSGLYIDSVLFSYQFPAPPSHEKMQKLKNMTIEQLKEYCIEHNIKLPVNDKNMRHLMQTIIQNDNNPKRSISILPNTIVVGITTDKKTLKQKSTERTEHMLANGVVEEATILGNKYGWNSSAMTGSIYRLVKLYLENGLSLKELVEKNTTLDMQLAKRQMTWFKRNSAIVWLPITEAEDYILSILARE